MNAAYEVFSRNSYKNASMSRLADAGGVSKSLLFHYFLSQSPHSKLQGL
ncbi:TetR/AcrR family transcriptional regulator [Otoolea muris]